MWCICVCTRLVSFRRFSYDRGCIDVDRYTYMISHFTRMNSWYYKCILTLVGNPSKSCVCLALVPAIYDYCKHPCTWGNQPTNHFPLCCISACDHSGYHDTVCTVQAMTGNKHASSIWEANVPPCCKPPKPDDALWVYSTLSLYWFFWSSNYYSTVIKKGGGGEGYSISRRID